MKKSKSLFGRLNNEVRRNSADKATAFHRSSLREKALPQNACRPKLCALSVLSGNENDNVNLCESVKSVVNLDNFYLVISVNLWLKINLSAVALAKADQSKITNYAKRTQFPKKSNVCKLSEYNGL
jgi:hypothetical protein